MDGEMLIDTGAQDAMIGVKALDDHAKSLKKYNLKPVRINRHQSSASGVGGETTILGVVQIPVGTAGVNTVLNMRVCEHDVPPLIPMPWCHKYGLVLDTTKQQCHFTALIEGGVSTVYRALPSHHIALNVCEFKPNKKWNVGPLQTYNALTWCMGIRLHMLAALDPNDYYVDPTLNSAGGSINSSSYLAYLKRKGRSLHMRPQDVVSASPNSTQQYIQALNTFRRQ